MLIYLRYYLLSNILIVLDTYIMRRLSWHGQKNIFSIFRETVLTHIFYVFFKIVSKSIAETQVTLTSFHKCESLTNSNKSIFQFRIMGQVSIVLKIVKLTYKYFLHASHSPARFHDVNA